MQTSSNSFVSTVDLTLKPSIRALQIVFALHMVGIALSAFAMPQGWPMALLLLAFAASWLSLRRHPALGFGTQAITRMIWHSEGQWTLYRANGMKLEAELLPGSVVHDWALLLRFRTQGGRKVARLLLGDELPAESLSRLRARLSVSA